MKFFPAISLIVFLLTGINVYSQSEADSVVKIPAYRLHLGLTEYGKLSDPLEKKINYNTLALVGVGYAGAIGAVHIYQAHAWWQEQDNKFRVMNDWEYALWIDKIGHFYGTNILAHIFSGGLEAANFDSERSYIYSALMALAFETYVEIEDGFGPNWGFSPGDFLFDFLGASYYLSQYYFPTLKHIQPKMSYYPTQAYLDGEHKGNAIDDYEGQKYWLAFRMKELLPDKVASYWPSFLQIAAGMGIRNMDGSGGGQREFYIALDFDAETLPLHGRGWDFVKNTLNYIHLPMPGIRITPDAAFIAFCY